MNFMNMSRILVLLAVLLVSACSASTVSKREADAGISKTFTSSYASVIQASITALNTHKLQNTITNQGADQTSIAFSKPADLISWGANGRLIVRNAGEGRTIVNVTTAKNVAVNITAPTEKSFANKIYGEMDKLLVGSSAN